MIRFEQQQHEIRRRRQPRFFHGVCEDDDDAVLVLAARGQDHLEFRQLFAVEIDRPHIVADLGRGVAAVLDQGLELGRRALSEDRGYQQQPEQNGREATEAAPNDIAVHV